MNVYRNDLENLKYRGTWSTRLTYEVKDDKIQKYIDALIRMKSLITIFDATQDGVKLEEVVMNAFLKSIDYRRQRNRICRKYILH